VRWRWVLLASGGVYLLSIMLISVVIGVYAMILVVQTGGMPDAAQIEKFAGQIGPWGGMATGILLMVGAAVWAARKAGTAPRLHGVLVGLVTTLISFCLDVAGGKLPGLMDAAAYVLILGAGWLGGLIGQAILAGQETLYRASRAIGAARSPQDIVVAIGEHLADPEVSQIALWRVEEEPMRITLLAAWAPRGAQAWRPGLCLDATQAPSLARLAQGTPLLLRTAELPTSERAIWEALKMRSAILLPLVTSDGVMTGLLMVASQGGRGFDMRTYLTISTQVALALENLRLIEQARHAAILEERQRLAREIHDTLAQGFTSIVMHLEAAEQALGGDLAAVQRHLDQARRTARESLAEARRLVWALRPEPLERTSLPKALRRVTARWSERSGIEAKMVTTGNVYPLPPQVEVTLLRAAQEALANVRKHAQATRVTVTLSYMDDLVVLDVQDNGLGFEVTWPPTAEAKRGLGLLGIRERVEQLGGTLLIESTPGQGTTLVVEIPIASNRQDGRGDGADSSGHRR